MGSKQRFSDTNVRISRTIRKQVKDYKCAIIYDDEISTGSSVVELSQILLKTTIRRICVVCTHGLFTGQAVERLNSIPQIQEIIVTDTVPTPSKEALPNLTVLSVAETFGEAIRKNYLHESIGTLFTFWEEDEEDLWAVHSHFSRCSSASSEPPDSGQMPGICTLHRGQHPSGKI